MTRRRTSALGSPGGPAVRAVLLLIIIGFALLQIVPFVIAVANSAKCLPAVQKFPQSIFPVAPFGTQCSEGGATLPAEATSGAATFSPSAEGYLGLAEFPFDQWFMNSLIFGIGVTVLRLVLDSLAGYAFAKLRFRGNKVLFLGVISTMMIPSIVLLVPRFILLQQLGMLNTYQGVLLTLGVDAFGIFLMKQYFEAIPDDLIEAAGLDGAGVLRTFVAVVLPISRPGLAALAILSFTSVWNNFIDVLVLVGGDQSMLNLPLGLALLRGQYGETLVWNVFLAGSVLTTVPMLILFIIFQRQFTASHMNAGIRG